MIFKKTIFFFLLILLVYPLFVYSHCPLCVAGAGILVIAGYELGVKKIVIGLLIGGLAIAFAEWFNRLIKKKFFKGQEVLVVFSTFILTYLSIKNFIFDYAYFSLPFLNSDQFIMIDKSLVSAVFGGFLVWVAPFLSRLISKKRGKTILFQRIIITLVLLIITSLILQFSF